MSERKARRQQDSLAFYRAILDRFEYVARETTDSVLPTPEAIHVHISNFDGAATIMLYGRVGRSVAQIFYTPIDKLAAAEEMVARYLAEQKP